MDLKEEAILGDDVSSQCYYRSEVAAPRGSHSLSVGP